MKLTLLGTGTPAPSLTRQSSGYLVEIGDDTIVLDHGPGAMHRLLEAGRQPTDVTHLFLTHLHYDHIADYPRLMLQRWDQGAGTVPELQVFGPKPVAEITEKLFGEDGVYGLDLESRVNHPSSQRIYAARGGTPPRAKPVPDVREITAGDVVQGEGWRVTAGAARHFQPILECLGYRIECDAGTVVYSGDSGGVLQSMIDLARDCDVLIHMCHFESATEPDEAFRISCGGHMDVAEVARQANAKTLVLTHFPPPLDAPGCLERLVADIRTVFDGRVIIGRDLLEVPITADHSVVID
ncbi:MAG: MBL fold metallo-hydrolase [Hyphomicrobiaceae bacterium]|nr:MBL fold metallo-hydrolase [Hyphomicrobiaceae bacterium]